MRCLLQKLQTRDNNIWITAFPLPLLSRVGTKYRRNCEVLLLETGHRFLAVRFQRAAGGGVLASLGPARFYLNEGHFGFLDPRTFLRSRCKLDYGDKTETYKRLSVVFIYGPL